MSNPHARRFAGSIIVGANGQPDSEPAIRWAGEQARLEGRALFALTSGRGLGEPAARAALQELSPVPIEQVPGRGSAARELIALSRWAHMIVVGSRGRGPTRSMLFGSVGAAVARGAHCPVVVCRPPSWADSGQGVVVGVDGSADARSVVEFAFAQAALRRLPLTVLHCFWNAADIGTHDSGHRRVPVDREDVQDLRLALDTTVAGLQSDHPDVDVTLRLEAGNVADVLGSGAQGWDLIVVGHRRQDRLDRWLLGSSSAAVLGRAHTAVAVVPQPTSEDGRSTDARFQSAA